MPVQTDVPTGLGALTVPPNNWGFDGAADKMAAVAANDGNSSFVFASSGGTHQLITYLFPDLVGVVDPVTGATLSVWARKHANGVGGQNFPFYWNGASLGVNHWASLTNDGAYCYITDAAAGAGLAVSAVNGQHGMEFWAAGGPDHKAEVWVTYFARVVNFEYQAGASGEFSYLMGSLLAGMIGAGLLLREMPALARAMARVWRGNRNVRLRADELEPAWRAWRAFRFPVYSVR